MSVRILIGDCREKLHELPDGSVHCCVTSPPYFGLRDYGTAQWEGGDDSCDHKQTTARKDGGRAGVNGFNGSSAADSDTCGKCGATRIDRQMGLEPTPDEYVAGMVEVFREVRRVLRDDGTLWLNIGDSYAGSWGNYGGKNRGKGGQREINGGSLIDNPAYHGTESLRPPTSNKIEGTKPKDLIGIPWLLAFALRADGWFLRQDIIWSKPNPMPESVRDRCTKAHEYLFLLSKGPRYFYDAEAIQEPGSGRIPGNKVPTAIQSATVETAANGNGIFAAQQRPCETRNRRSVWEVATQPFSEAHFATYPPVLIEPCILAGCPKGGTVLDPFFGAGTTGLVADRLQRNCIGIELNPEYAEIARNRIAKEAGLFGEVLAA